MVTKYPVFVLCGRDHKKRPLIIELDPDEKYKVKSLLPFLGKRVIDWQLEALKRSPYVDEFYLLGISEEMAKFDYPIHYVPVPTVSTYGEKLLAGVEYLRKQGRDDTFFVVSSSDTPGITTEAINNFFEQLEEYKDYDFVQSVVPAATTEKVFPDHQRVSGKFKDVVVFPGELFALSEYGIVGANNIINEIGSRRRKIKITKRTSKMSAVTPIIRLVFKHPRTWPLIMKYALGKLSLEGGEKIINIFGNGKAKAVIVDDALFGMDIDIPGDYEKVKKYLSKKFDIPYTPGLG